MGIPNGSETAIHAINAILSDTVLRGGCALLKTDIRNAYNETDRKIMLEQVRKEVPEISSWVEFCIVHLPTYLLEIMSSSARPEYSKATL